MAPTYLLALFCLYICIILWRKTSNASSLFSSPATPKPSPAEVAPLGSKIRELEHSEMPKKRSFSNTGTAQVAPTLHKFGAWHSKLFKIIPHLPLPSANSQQEKGILWIKSGGRANSGISFNFRLGPLLRRCPKKTLILLFQKLRGFEEWAGKHHRALDKREFYGVKRRTNY